MGLLFSTVRSTWKSIEWSTARWRRWTGGGTKTIPLWLTGPDGTRTRLRYTVLNFGWTRWEWIRMQFSLTYLFLKAFQTILQKGALTLNFSLWRVLRTEDLELWIYFLKGREREDAPMLFKGYNWSSFWLLNCELWPYIYIFCFVNFWRHLWLEKCIPC